MKYDTKNKKFFVSKTPLTRKEVFDLITFGGAVVDAFLDTGIEEKNNELCFLSGTKILVKDLRFTTGGGGTNTAVSFSKLGFKTAMLGKIGIGGNASMILRDLEAANVKFIGVQCHEETGYSVVLGSKEMNRTILTFKGANETITFNELDLNKLDAPWFYFSSMVGKTLKTQIQLANWARKKGIKVAYNPSAYLTNQGSKVIKNLLKNVNVLILNDEEARGLVPKGDLFQGLHKFGVEIVCITYGKKGNAVSDGKNLFYSLPRKIKVVERTGAGDAFASGFVAGIIKTNDVQTAVQVGSLNAESVIQKPGAKNGLMTWKEVLREMKTNPVKIGVRV